MRFRVLANGYSPLNRVKLLAMRLLFGASALDPARAAFYHPRSFGRPYYALQHDILRGRSPWTVGERELFVAFVSAKINSPFCAGSHGALAGAALKDRELVRAVLENYESAPVDDCLKAMLRFLEKLTLQPEQISEEDIVALRAAGLDDRQIEDAAWVSIIFSIGNREADAIGFQIPTPGALKLAVPVILRFGYRAYT